MVPLRTLVSVGSVLGPISIKRYNQFQSASINATPTAGISTGDAIKALECAAADALPDGYRLTWTGTAVQELEVGALVVVFFGMITATFVGTFFIPPLYAAMQRLVERRYQR